MLITPHPDDEVLFCGIVMQRRRCRCRRCIVYATDGDDNPQYVIFDSAATACEKSEAIYTDEPRPARAPGWQLILAEYSRSVVIYGRHHDVRLFHVERMSVP
jgi:hypothetical protein